MLISLYKLASIGDILGIEVYVHNLENQDQRYSAFAAKVLQWKKTFQIIEIREFIEQFMEGDGE